MMERMQPPSAWAFLGSPRTSGSLGTLGRHDVRRVIGRGAFGVVFEARDTVTDRRVALKVPLHGPDDGEGVRRAFRDEARALAEVRHEHVVRLIGEGEDPVPFLVMEHVEGATLDAIIRSRGPLDPAFVVAIGRQIAAGLAAVHARGLVHRDVKPANIVVAEGHAPRATLIDFGLAQVQEDAWRVPEGSLRGTPQYMAPEQAAGKTADYPADLFSLGAVLYHMLTGSPPFQAPTESGVITRLTWEAPRPVRDLAPAAPEPLVAVIAKLLAKSPVARFHSAGEAAFALDGAAGAPNASMSCETILGLRILSRSETEPVATGASPACSAGAAHRRPPAAFVACDGSATTIPTSHAAIGTPFVMPCLHTSAAAL
jgi:eukaryotic-like serine/threonine-protein kinase